MSSISFYGWLIIGFEALLSLPISYLAVLAIAAAVGTMQRRQRCEGYATPHTTFGILIPAHNEELVLGTLLSSLDGIDYPRAFYSIHVVADNCTDFTASLARSADNSIHVHERRDPRRRGKGHALNWLLRELADDGLSFDAYVILDADSTVNPSFLLAMNDAVRRGARALQARQNVLNAAASRSTALRSVALSLMNHLRPLGRNALGASATLCGNGMCLSRALLQQHPWTAVSSTEDYEYYLDLVGEGERIWFVPDAVVSSLMPTTFAQMETQEIRWSAGAGPLSKWRRARILLRAAITNRDLARAEALAEFLTPSLTSLVIGCVAIVVGSAALSFLTGLAIASGLIAGVLLYVSTGIWLSDLPPAVYTSLVAAPAFMLWKLWVLIVVRHARKQTAEWVRTARPAE